jgi:hypothetical protein
VRRVRIETGATLGEVLEAKSGVKPGEKIVLKPAENLADGAQVKVTTK